LIFGGVNGKVIIVEGEKCIFPLNNGIKYSRDPRLKMFFFVSSMISHLILKEKKRKEKKPH
jgi:hypothetical protein